MYKPIVAACLLFMLSTNFVRAKETIFDIIEDVEGLSIIVKMDYDTLIMHKMKDFETKGDVQFLKEGKEILSLSAVFTVRGKYRRRICDFPPLLIDFDKDELDSLGLRKTDKYKLVTHCFNTSNNKRYVYREDLAYKLYRSLTDNSFRTKVFNIKYMSERGSTESVGILIESKKELAKRLDGKNCSCIGLKDSVMDIHAVWQTSLFQYMIGNNDMNLYTEHNVQFIEKEEEKSYVPVPYDFDYSFLVNTQYGNKKSHITNFSNIFPKSRDANIFHSVASEYNKHRPTFERIILGYSPLSEGDRKRCVRVINSFYGEINKSSFWKRLSHL